MSVIRIELLITIPEGATVALGAPQTSAPSVANDPNEPPHPAESAMQQARQIFQTECPVHHVPWKTVPAGVSKKNGKPYDSFLACPERDCPEKPR